MDNQRLLTWSFFGFMVFLTWQAWVEDYRTPAAVEPATAQTTESAPTVPSTDGVPTLQNDLPSISEPASGDVPSLASPAPVPAETTAASTAEIVRVTTDVLDLEISTVGATLQRARLLSYPVSKDDPDTLVELLSPTVSTLGLIETGLIIANNNNGPNHTATFSASESSYSLGNNETLAVDFTWRDDSGLSLTKTFTFRRGSYIIEVEQALSNGGADAVAVGAYAQIRRRSYEAERSMFDVDSYSFDGPIIFDGERSEKLDRDDLQRSAYVQTSDDGWVATIQHHFLNAIVPPSGSEQNYTVEVAGNIAKATFIDKTAVSVPPGQTATFSTTAFVGPKLQAQLEQVQEKLTLTVDYGWLTMISGPLFALLSFVFSYVQNWGLAIIIVTILIKAVFYKLTEASGRSMAKMREIQPRMKALQDRYKDDRQALSQAMMELYKREKVNPAAGCLPILIQMPFFLAFYWVLLESVEMRQAPFALWITDLSSRDPYFILPLIMGAAMLGQQKLNPAPADPVQARVMQIMPVMFTGFFAFFPSGLVLYWVTNTLLSIAQQWHINKVVHAEGQKRKSGKSKKKKGDSDNDG